jgi:hypothetical protein
VGGTNTGAVGAKKLVLAGATNAGERNVGTAGAKKLV